MLYSVSINPCIFHLSIYPCIFFFSIPVSLDILSIYPSPVSIVLSLLLWSDSYPRLDGSALLDGSVWLWMALFHIISP